MSTQDILQLIMMGVVFLCGYFYLFQLAARRTENKNSVPLVAIVLLIIYALITIPLMFILSRMGSTSLILISLLLLFSSIILLTAFIGLTRHFREVNKGMLALLVVYILAVAYVTVFSRSSGRTIGSDARGSFLFRADLIREAVRTRSLEPVNHLLLNVALFVPLGVLLPFIYPKELSRWTYALMAGLMLTTAIEVTQLMLRLGQADLTDMVTNTLGALIGYGLYRMIQLFLPRKEEEEA